jgi:hypothetical protein
VVTAAYLLSGLMVPPLRRVTSGRRPRSNLEVLPLASGPPAAGPLAPSLLQGPAYKGRPWPFTPLAASMRLAPLHNDSARPSEWGGWRRLRVRCLGSTQPTAVRTGIAWGCCSPDAIREAMLAAPPSPGLHPGYGPLLSPTTARPGRLLGFRRLGRRRCRRPPPAPSPVAGRCCTPVRPVSRRPAAR